MIGSSLGVVLNPGKVYAGCGQAGGFRWFLKSGDSHRMERHGVRGEVGGGAGGADLACPDGRGGQGADGPRLERAGGNHPQSEAGSSAEDDERGGGRVTGPELDCIAARRLLLL